LSTAARSRTTLEESAGAINADSFWNDYVIHQTSDIVILSMFKKYALSRNVDRHLSLVE